MGGDDARETAAEAAAGWLRDLHRAPSPRAPRSPRISISKIDKTSASRNTTDVASNMILKTVSFPGDGDEGGGVPSACSSPISNKQVQLETRKQPTPCLPASALPKAQRSSQALSP